MKTRINGACWTSMRCRRGSTRACSCSAASPSVRIQHHFFDRQSHAAMHDLHGLAHALPDNRRAQDVVPHDHLAAAHRRSGRRRSPLSKRNCVDSRYGSPSPPEEMMKQDAVLQRRQRIDVLTLAAPPARARRSDRSPPGVSSISGSMSGAIASVPAAPGSGSPAPTNACSSRLTASPRDPPAPVWRTARARRPAAPSAAGAPPASPPAANARPTRRSCRAGRRDRRFSTSAQISAIVRFRPRRSAASYPRTA